jgi:serine/threonine-protein kinase RsbW
MKAEEARGRARADGPVTDAFEMVVPATADRLHDLREAAQRFAADHGVADPANVALAVSEACANVVVHAYEDRPAGAVRLSGRRVDGRVDLTVSDEGRGFVPHPGGPGIGMGVPLMTELADHVVIHAENNSGTRLEMSFAVGGGRTH